MELTAKAKVDCKGPPKFLLDEIERKKAEAKRREMFDEKPAQTAEKPTLRERLHLTKKGR